MEELPVWLIIIFVISIIVIGIEIMRIINGLADYLSNKAKYFDIKNRILKAKNKDIFNKWYD